MTDNRTTELLCVGDILWNEPCDERMVVVAADSVCVWVRKVEKNDKLMMVGGDVWASLSMKRGIKNRCSQYYAQTMFELDGHVEQAIAATLGSEYHGYEQAAIEAWESIKAWNTRAELGSGTCEYVVKDNMNESEGMGDVWIECSACHCQFDYYADDWLMKMSYCPNCGARIRKAVER